jgi:hypothetical protein
VPALVSRDVPGQRAAFDHEVMPLLSISHFQETQAGISPTQIKEHCGGSKGLPFARMAGRGVGARATLICSDTVLYLGALALALTRPTRSWAAAS